MSKFTLTQKEAITIGMKYRSRLVRVAKNATTSARFTPTYIYSPPGLGKTYTVNEAIKAAGVNCIEVSGNVSMFAFGIQLATIAYLDQVSSRIMVSVDDCDGILKNDENINIIKNMLEGRKKYKYQKNMQSQMANLSERQKEAIAFHSCENKMGFEVDTSRFVFIFTSNFKLPTDDDVIKSRIQGASKATLLAHQNAVRSRCHTSDFELAWETQWGWIADVVMNTNAVDILRTKKQKIFLLDWIYKNWDMMTERSIRTAKKMAEMLIDDAESCVEDWEIDFLK